MKKQVLFQTVMIVLPLCLLMVGFFPGTMTAICQTAEGLTEVSYSAWGTLPDEINPGGFLLLLVLGIVIGSVAFRITGREKTLGWVIVGSLAGIAVYWLTQYRYTDICIQFHVVILILLICEFVLAVGYKFGQKFSIFV